MDNRPIGIFDSGLGGLTAARALTELLPHESIVYFGDTGRVPYGTRSRETIGRYTAQDVRFLESHNVKFIVAACGTASSVGLPTVKASVPVIGVVEPTAAAAAAATKNGRIGVIGTAATIRSGSFSSELRKINGDLQIFEKACPLFVPLVENGFISEDDDVALTVAHRYLDSLKDCGVDTLIMGCTHFPLLRGVISQVMGEDVALIDAGYEISRKTAQMLRESDSLSDSGGECSFFVTDKIEGFLSIAEIFFGREIKSDIQHVDIESFN